MTFRLRTGVSLLEAATAPLVQVGWRGGTLGFSGGAFDPFRYVMPGPPDDASHVAYFSAPRAPVGATRIERANATFGWHQGKPFLHCHAAWIEPDGQRRGGHILNDETILTSAVEVEAWGFSGLRIETSIDEETNFTLLQPSGTSQPGANAVLARVRPNQDITAAVEALARAHGMPDAIVEGSVGSLIGTRFDDAPDVDDHATEVLVTNGAIRGGIATIDLMSVDMAGHVHEGRLTRGENPVCITFDLVLIRGSRPG